jgi:hypothetical protein
MQAEEWGILQWQVVLASLDPSPELALEIRVLLPSVDQGAYNGVAPESRLIEALEGYFYVLAENRHLFQIKFVKGLTKFEKSSTAGKVIHFIEKTQY